MKKDRQSFFNESAFQQSGYNAPMPNYNMGMPTNYPMNSGYGSQSSQSFYTGPMMNGMTTNTSSTDYMSDIESRLTKIERQINRLDARISKLESKGVLTTENYDSTTNMYML